MIEEKDPEMVQLLKEDHNQCITELKECEEGLLDSLIPVDDADVRNAMFELRPGAGGEEAGLFAVDMLRMYEKFARRMNWGWEVLSLTTSGLGALKEATIRITGQRVFEMLKYESGVHRVQRVPVTESGGRIHTSTMSIVILPEAEAVDVQIDEKDLRIDTFRASGPGGQAVNKTDSAVRIVHLPTGLTVSIQDERSQHQNRLKAMTILRTKLYEMERSKAHTLRNSARSGQIGSGERHERIRTYNFPQDRITDHRIGLTLHNLALMMEGELLEQFIQPLKDKDREEKLQQLDIDQ